MEPVQPQFDIFDAAKTAGTLVAATVINLSRILSLCFKEDVQPLVIPPLERLGSWLMVDPQRIQLGEQALERLPAPKIWNLGTLSILIGLDNNPSRSLVKTVSRSNSLISVVLLLSGCTACFNTDQASQMIHELMRLAGILKDYEIPRGPVRQFADAMNGCREYMAEDSFTKVYNTIAAAIHNSSAARGRPIYDLTKAGEIKELASLIYEVMSKVQDAENRLVELKGVRQGLWLAALFIWLRPYEVELLVNGALIYPEQNLASYRANSCIRLQIQLNSSSGVDDGSWTIKSWTATQDSVPVLINLKDMTDIDFGRQHASPLGSAKCQLSNTIPISAVNAIGRLAAALLVVTTEHGYLLNRRHTTARRILDLCSSAFLNIYPNIMQRFGWMEDVLEPDKQKKEERALLEAINEVYGAQGYRTDSDIDFLAHVVDTACRRYRDTHSHSMLLASGESGEDLVIENGIYLAGEALLYAFCVEIPEHSFYRPLEPFRLQESAGLIRSLLQDRQESEVPRGYGFWEFRKRAIEFLVPGAAVVESGDLAVSGNGYVVYSAALADWSSQLTEQRGASTLYMAPGPLKAVDVEGKLARLTEDDQSMALGGRVIQSQNTIKLYEGEQCCLDERMAINRTLTKVVHFKRTDSVDGPQTMRIATYIELGILGGRMKTSWERSTEALIFATHIKAGNSRAMQLKMLAKKWELDGHLGEKLQWCNVGRAIGRKARYVAQTSENEHLRFFEAGNLVDEHRIFVKHSSVSLLECIKQAMEKCREDEFWVIIA